jgi:hypothetical protein
MNSYFEKSRCKVSGFLHDFKIIDDSEASVELCQKCFTKIYIPRDPWTGELNILLDVKYHKREMLRPQDKEYFREYKNGLI